MCESVRDADSARLLHSEKSLAAAAGATPSLVQCEPPVQAKRSRSEARPAILFITFPLAKRHAPVSVPLKSAGLVVGDGLADFVRRVHDEGAVACHRLVERLAGGPGRVLFAAGQLHRIARTEDGDLAAYDACT